MLVLRMIRNAVSTLVLLISLSFAAVRLAPFYLPAEQAQNLHAALAQGMARVWGARQSQPSPEAVMAPSWRI